MDASTFNANGDNFNSPTGLAYNNYLIEDSTFLNPSASNLAYSSALGIDRSDPSDLRTVHQQEDIQTSGAQNQWNFAYGINLNDKLFVGAGLGISSLRYQRKNTYRESDFKFVLAPTYHPLNNLVLEEELKIVGTGTNLNIGVIARPIDFIQVGLSYNSRYVFFR